MDFPRLTRLPRLTLLLSLSLLAACAGQGEVREAAPAAITLQSADSAMPVANADAESTAAANAEPGSAAVDAGVDTNGAPASAPPTAAAVGADATPAQAARTQAEQDYDAIYGAQTYNPVYDPTLPTPAQMPTSYDPWEKLNRKVYAFNEVVDRAIATPLAKAYVQVVPRPVRLGVGNFFDNLGQPVSAVNALLQGKPKRAGQALGRFVINTTIGVAGLFDVASKAHIPNHSEDFGQTLGVWGWKRSRFVELPLFGPRTVRDTFGLIGDAPLAPIRYIEDDKTRVFLQGLQLVDVRTQLFAVDAMRQGATDPYALVRDAWLQRRNYQIFGDSKNSQDDTLPAYLREDQDNPTVPADAMPIIPGGVVR